MVTIPEVNPKKDLKLLNWFCKKPLFILAFEILFKSTAVSRDRRMQVKRIADKEEYGREL